MTTVDGAAVSPADAFIARARRTPAAPFLVAPASAELAYAPSGFSHSYGDVLGRLETLRERLAAAGYGRGSRVALLMENRPEFFWTWLALNSLGVAIHPLNPELQAADLAYQFSVVEPNLAIALPAHHRLIRAADATLPLIAPDEPPPRCARPHAAGAPAGDDACAFLFTSGTTGRPKCCVLSNAYFLGVGRWYVSQGGMADVQDGAEVLLTPLPMFHMNALACSTVAMILNGGAIVPLDRFHARRWWRSVADSRATIVHYLGVMPAVLLKLDAEPAERAHRLKFGFGSGVDARHHEIFERRFGFPLIEGWAMTETGGGGVTSTAQGPRHIGQRCMGRPAASMEVRIVDDAGVDVAPGQPGEFLVRTGGVEPRRGFFSGYLKDEAATREAWAGGWFHTGDVVRSDGESLFFVDRKKNIVRRSGENIAVIEVEGVLDTLPEIAAAAVAPVPDDIRGEEVLALIKLREPPRDGDHARAVAQDIASACAEKLAYFKVPGYVAFVDALPVTATQKLQRTETRAMAARAVTAADTIDLREYKATLRARDWDAMRRAPERAGTGGTGIP
jgi:acyl-CoA synthetase (AMP-forming)/AMP-acid ligase II